MEKSCSDCPEPTLAQSLCTLCNKWLCYQCTDVHQHQRAPAMSQCTTVHQQQKPSATQCPDLHQRGSSTLPPTGQGPGSYPCPLLMCHSHRQEPLELFCESCDLLCCSSCHLSSHKNHRVVPIGKALQDQQWLFESLMVQVEERRSAVENNAKQTEDRLHGVKIAHRKAENQIKMAKMIMINELNKRANLLIEQLEKISEDFQQHLEDQLQGAIEMCGQLDHVHKFIAWATTHHCRGPVLFSRALISLQMQQLFESSLHSDSWSPVKIKFNWDASYWTKQMSSLGQLMVEGGNCSHPQGLACPSVLRPQSMSCLALPSVCHRGREAGCGYQACCETQQMCCLHGLPSQPDRSGLDKSQLEAVLCNSSCVQPASLHQQSQQQVQRCWDPDGSTQRPPPPSSPVPKSYLYQQQQRDRVLPDGQTNAERSRPGQCQRKRDLGSLAAAGDRDVMTEDDDREHRRRAEAAGGRERPDDEPQQSHTDSTVHVSPAAELRKEQQRNRPALTLRNHRDAKRSTSLEGSVTAQECVSDVQSSRLSPGLVCARRKRRSQSIPSTNPYSERPTGCTHGPEARAANKYTSMDSRQRRASDGVLCAVKETLSDFTPFRGYRSPLLSYKTEPDHSFSYVNEEIDYEAKEKCRLSGNHHNSNIDDQKDSGRPRVPVVCLERLKILVSRIPPHGRRQSDPLPATEKADTQQRHAAHQGLSGGPKTTRTRSLTAPPYARRHVRSPSASHSASSESDGPGRLISVKALPDPMCVPQSYSSLDLDSDSDLDQQLDSPDSEPHVSSECSSDAEPHCSPRGDLSMGETGLCGEQNNITGNNSEPSLEYESDPESDASPADADSGDAGTECDEEPRIQAETDSDAVSDPLPGSLHSAESELDLDSEPELTTDDPQPLRSDLEDESNGGHGQSRQLLIANPDAQSSAGEVEPEEGEEEEEEEEEDSAGGMESEDFCAVCLIGGDLLCCDRCPKVFHLSCHIPSLLSFPSGDWVCSLCRDVVQPEVEYNCENARTSEECTSAHGLPAPDQRKCELLTLSILSNILSAPFHEPVSPLARHYYQIIKRPMDLSVIRAKLNKRNTGHYNSADQFVADVHLMFRNCAKFNYPDSEVAQAGRSLEQFFISKMKEVFPDSAYPVAEADSDSDEYDEAYKTNENGFPWPERREQCHRKRKRRNSLKSRRNHF